MPHEIRRVLRAFAAQPWFIDPRKAEQIVAMLELRAGGLRAEPFREGGPAASTPVSETQGKVAIIRLYGPIMPRAEALKDVSQQAALMTDFQRAFKAAANDASVGGIVIDIDSPGGQVDLVPETAAMIFAARKPGRPIVAVANTLACSAAYWIACAADELVVTPSGEVGSIGVYVLHEDVSGFLDEVGVKMTFVYEGARKVEGNPFEPLGAEAKVALQASVRAFYDLFVADVAKGRNVPEAVVRADPVTEAKHFGGGRAYPAAMAVTLGMADKVETLDSVIARLLKAPAGRSTASARAALL
ncbi:S49 family peptidase [Mesorhizobium sp. M7A.F.Ce.TU.012.03.2.1]|uniref:S49 family peptidase n=1 Tax=Mesorhizobium sp. M7A.F.Ce.TU.012.03.2.1 TaxID=2493681 RepID=UPI000FD7211F|nr:S49 family peptidase [Mesorhizobium sp. M7A.F.Ce.TU.012.03.2.1]AZV21461.1 S49 family peptidase [Mesorhizobium sp. M7A.F.Ce.TU.012.03.2.1]